jgi:hypothetical protein
MNVWKGPVLRNRESMTETPSEAFWTPKDKDHDAVVRFFSFVHTVTKQDVELNRIGKEMIGHTIDFFHVPYSRLPGKKRIVKPTGYQNQPDTKLRPLEKCGMVVHVAGQDALQVWESTNTIRKRLLDIMESPDYKDETIFGPDGIDFFVMTRTERAAIDRYTLLPRPREKARQIPPQARQMDLWQMPEFMPDPDEKAEKKPIQKPETVTVPPKPEPQEDNEPPLKPGDIIRMRIPSGEDMSGQVADGPDDEGLFTIIAEDTSAWTVKPDEVTVVRRA